MKSEYLTYFLDMADTCSLNKTAENFFTSHQVIRNAIAGLEKELGVTLITSTNQGSHLTPAGEITARYAKILIDSIDLLNKDLKPYQKSNFIVKKQTLQFCTTPYLSDDILLDFINQYQKADPSIHIELICVPFPDLLHHLNNPSTVCLIHANSKYLTIDWQREIQNYGLEYRILATRQLYICAPSKSKWVKKDYLQNADLATIPLVLKYTSLAAMPELSNSHFVNSFEAQKKMIKMHNGIGLVTQTEFERYFKPDAGFALTPADLPSLHYICIVQSLDRLPKYAQDFIEALKTIL